MVGVYFFFPDLGRLRMGNMCIGSQEPTLRSEVLRRRRKNHKHCKTELSTTTALDQNLANLAKAMVDMILLCFPGFGYLRRLGDPELDLLSGRSWWIVLRSL